jgi:type IV pilus assembly protein PilC
MEQLTRSGVPLLEALTDLRDTLCHPRLKETAAAMIESIEGGCTLSQAMEEHPKVFGEIFCSLVRAGESAGRLPEALKGLEESLKWEDELASHTRKLLVYPAFVGAVVTGITVFLMIYLVPQMSSFIANMGQALPLHTRILFATSAFFREHWPFMLAIPAAAAIALKVLVQTSPTARRRFDDAKLRLPLVGGLLRKVVLSRFAAVLAMTYASGIAIIEAVRKTEDVVGNAAVRDGLQRAGRLIAEGHTVTGAFQNIGLFPPLVIRMLGVGERTGALDAALLNVAYFYNRDVKESVEKLQSMVEPALTLLLGALLGWVMLAVLGPIYDTIAKLKF